MTVSAQTPINRSTGNGVTTVFPYTFKIIADADIEVTVDDVVKTLNVDYTVSGAGVDAGGNVTMTVAPANATSVVRRRNMALVRSTDYQDQGELPATTLDNDIDATVLMVQQLDERLDRTFSLPASFSGDSTLPAPEPGYLIGWDATGKNLTNIPASVGNSLVDLSAPSGSSLIGYQPAGTGAVATTVQAKLRESVSVSVKDFGAVGDGVTNDTAAVQAWLNISGNLVLNDGTYLVDQVTASSNTNITGNGTLKARGTQNSVLYVVDKSNVTINGIKVDGNNTVLSCIRAYSNTGTLDNIKVVNCEITGAKDDATLQYGGVEVSRLGASIRATNITVTNNKIYSLGSHGVIVAYADNVTVSDNVLNSIGQHGAEAVDCTRVNMTGNRIYHCGTVGPGGSGLGVGTHSSDFAISGNTLYNCGGDASITVEHNSIRGAISGNVIESARTAGINASFGTAIAAPFDILRDISITGNTVIGDGTNTTNRSGILVYSSSAASGTGIVVTGNTVRKFNIGLNMSYLDDSTASGNTFGDYVGSSTHAITLTFCRRMEVVGNSGGACSGNVVQLLNQSTNHCANINITGLNGTCTGFAMVYVEGDQTHVFIGLDTTSAAGWVFAASGASTISVIACRGNLSGTPIVATLSGVLLANNPPTHDYVLLSGSVVVRTGSGTPEGVVTAPVGSLFLRSDGGAGASIYVKETGGGNTGWVGK